MKAFRKPIYNVNYLLEKTRALTDVAKLWLLVHKYILSQAMARVQPIEHQTFHLRVKDSSPWLGDGALWQSLRLLVHQHRTHHMLHFIRLACQPATRRTGQAKWDTANWIHKLDAAWQGRLTLYSDDNHLHHMQHSMSSI